MNVYKKLFVSYKISNLKLLIYLLETLLERLSLRIVFRRLEIKIVPYFLSANKEL